jgi:Calcium-dependent channel, 7TM region, putative phosphate
LYIDGGLVFLCATALAPASPLLAPCALIYFLICGPLTTRNLIFVYRPNLDAGGARWPFLFEILMSSLFVGQIMMFAMMTLKRAYGPALAAMIPFIPCIVFRDAMRYTYLRPFTDASLYHTAELDGLDLKEPTSPELRETYRRFLVDAHKAAYVPVCLTRSNSRNEEERSYVFTSEPACIVKHDLDPCESLYQVTNDELQSSVPSSTHQQHPMEPEITNWQNASHKQSPRDSRVPVSHFLSSLEPYTQFGVSTRRVCSKNLVDLEKNGIHIHDDGSVTTSICSRRSTLHSVFKIHPQVSIDETDKND